MLSDSSRVSDDGFTLVEMLVAVLIAGVIIAPLSAVLLLGIGTTTTARATETHNADQQLVDSYFDSDVQSSTTVGTGAFCSGAGAIAVFNWVDPGGSSTVMQVAYVASAGLTRVVCKNGAEARRLQLAEGITSAAVSCAYGAGFGSCSAPTPRRVRLAISESTQDVGTENYSYSLTSTRRVGT